MQEIISKFPTFFSNHIIMVSAWIVVFVVFIISLFTTFFSKVKEISVAELVNKLNTADGVVFDIRKLEEFNSGHITNSEHVLLSDIEKKAIPRLDKYKQKPVIVVCERGMNAIKAGKLLSDQGFEQVFVLKEGILGWLAEHFPLIK